MNSIIKKIISIILVAGLILPLFGVEVYAKASSTKTFLLSIDPYVGEGNFSAEDTIEMELEAEIDAMNGNFHTSHHDWWILKNYDLLNAGEIRLVNNQFVHYVVDGTWCIMHK